MLHFLRVLMGTAKCFDVVWAEVVSMEILPKGLLPILINIMQVLPTRMFPFSQHFARASCSAQS